MIDPTTADAFRYIYAVLAMLTCTGFTATLILRWEVLHLGERLLRIGLNAEHMVIMYVAYVAITGNFTPTLVGVEMNLALAVVILGFAVWFGDLLIQHDREPRRLTDRRR